MKAATNTITGKSHHVNVIAGVFSKLKARYQYSKIKKALKEVEMIEAGKKKPKSMKDLLDEL